MKLLTLLTSLIITLASSNVFAQKFVCSNWFYEMRNGEEVEGTMFDGEKKDKNFFITDKHKMKRTLTYFATDGGFTYYISGNKDSSVKIFSIRQGAKKWSRDGSEIVGRYDFSINQIFGHGVIDITYCNHQ